VRCALTAIVTLAVLSTVDLARVQAASETARDVVVAAEEMFNRGLELAEMDPARAAETFDLAAAHYERLIEEFGIQSAGAQLNLGNARLLSGDIGRAIVAYRRAQRIDPSAADVQHALRHARTQVGLSVRPDAASTMESALRRGLSILGRSTLLTTGVCLWVCAWTLGLVRRARPRIPRGVPTAIGVCGLALLALPMAERVLDVRSSDGVLVSDDVVARAGPGAGVYDESFTTPLPGGVEVEMIRTQGRWTQIRLLDGRITWISSHAVERI